ncbi:MAG: Uma2 family endonuclease [Dehalococcoidia bacterium]|nr:Uma2 family endonuclease [Dehalococcoidia bacterium]
MTTIERPPTTVLPPLASGDRLTRAEFERRYEQCPGMRAELVEGVVYVASPVSIDHSESHNAMATWLGLYRSMTPGVRAANDGTVRLDADNEPQPDVYLRWDAAHGGQSHESADRRIEGAPELVAEVAATSASYDLHDKMNAYRRNGVQEYIAWQVYEQRLDWFRLREGVYVPLTPDERGVIHSEVFPGLRLNVAAMLAGDLATVVAEQLGPQA